LLLLSIPRDARLAQRALGVALRNPIGYALLVEYVGVVALELHDLVISIESFQTYAAFDALLEEQVAKRHALDVPQDVHSLGVLLSVLLDGCHAERTQEQKDAG
jgi:hypothetical protein